jgi:hypothetical protein
MKRGRVCGYWKVPTRELRSVSALRSEVREGLGIEDVPGVAICIKWYQSGTDSLFSIAEKKGGLRHAAQERKTITQSRG